MKKGLVFLACIALLSMGAMSAFAVESTTAPAPKKAMAANPIEQLTGEVWTQSTADVKKALLFGVECAISIEHAIASRLQEVEKSVKGKPKPSTLSPFEKAWSAAFQNVPREEIVEGIDTWYAQNPDKKQRPVFDVIWYELIAPKTK